MAKVPPVIIDNVAYWPVSELTARFDYGFELGAIFGVTITGILFGSIILILAAALVYIHHKLDSLLLEIEKEAEQ